MNERVSEVGMALRMKISKISGLGEESLHVDNQSKAQLHICYVLVLISNPHMLAIPLAWCQESYCRVAVYFSFYGDGCLMIIV